MCEHLQNLSEYLFPYVEKLPRLHVGFSNVFIEIWNNFISRQAVTFCLLTFRWPVRTISFNYTGEYIASASEDLFIDIVCIFKTSHYRILSYLKCLQDLSFLLVLHHLGYKAYLCLFRVGSFNICVY